MGTDLQIRQPEEHAAARGTASCGLENSGESVVKATEEIIAVRGGTLFMRRAGTGPTVMFLHGANGVLDWLPFFDQLSDRVDLRVPDHPSFGRSPAPAWLDEMSDLAYFYLDLFEQLKLTDIHLIGHSMGGWLAMEVAVRSQARLRSLTLISSVGLDIASDPVANLFIMPREQLMRAIYADPKILAAEMARTLSPQDLMLVMTNRVASTHLAWRDRRFCNPSLHKWLHRITVPTQILWGAQDGIVSAGHAAELKKLIPQAEVTVWPNVGHVPFTEKLDESVKAVGDFIARNG